MVIAAPFQLSLLILGSVLWKLGEGACVFPDPGPKKWKARAAYEAAHAGFPNVTLPRVGSGFNRTLNIDGFCNDVLFDSNSFNCEKYGAEFHAVVKEATGSFLRFDNVNCPLKGITIARTPPGAPYEAEMRFQFEWCKAAAGFPASPVASAAVVVNLQKEGFPPHKGAGPNLLGWMKEVCKIKPTPPPGVQIQMNLHTNLTLVGPGQCMATIKEREGDSQKHFIPGVKEMLGCKATCTGSMSRAEATGIKDDVCTGFAFNPGAEANKTCILYKSKVTEVINMTAKTGKGGGAKEEKARRLQTTPAPLTVAPIGVTPVPIGPTFGPAAVPMGIPTTPAPMGIPGVTTAPPAGIPTTPMVPTTTTSPPDQWHCYSMEMTKSAIGKTTPPPAGPALVWASKSLSQHLHLNEVMGGANPRMKEARFEHLDSKCTGFGSSWWFMMQDPAGNPASIDVKAEEWDEMMALLPPANPIDTPVQSDMMIDRVLVRTCKSVETWHRECILPEVIKTCSEKHLITAVVTGFVTPIAAWALVWMVYNVYTSGSRKSVSDLGNNADHSPKCSRAMVPMLSIIALIASGGFSFASSQSVELISGASECLHGERMLLVVAFSSGLAAALSIIIAILYLYKSSIEHAKLGINESSIEPKGSKLMLVEVADGQTHGIVHNPDVFESGGLAFDSALSSGSGQHPRRIPLQ